MGAEVWVDENDDGVIDPTVDTRLGLTNGKGLIDIPVEHRGKSLMARGGTDVTTSRKMPEGWLMPIAKGETVMTTLSNAIRRAMDAGASTTDNPDDDLTAQEALNLLYAEKVRSGEISQAEVPTPEDVAEALNYYQTAGASDSLSARQRKLVTDMATWLNEGLRELISRETGTGTDAEKAQTVLTRWADKLRQAEDARVKHQKAQEKHKQDLEQHKKDVAEAQENEQPEPAAPTTPTAPQPFNAEDELSKDGSNTSRKGTIDAAAETARQAAENFDKGKPTAVPMGGRPSKSMNEDSLREQDTGLIGAVKTENAPDSDSPARPVGNKEYLKFYLIDQPDIDGVQNDFGFQAAGRGDTLQSIIFIDLSGLKGKLFYYRADSETDVRVDVAANTGINVSDVKGGIIYYEPNANEFSAPDAPFSFTYRLSRETVENTNDALHQSEEVTMTFTVDPVNDRPTDVAIDGLTAARPGISGHAAFVIAHDGSIRKYDQHGNITGSQNYLGEMFARDVEDGFGDGGTFSDISKSFRDRPDFAATPFSIGGKDAAYFKVVAEPRSGGTIYNLRQKTAAELEAAGLTRKQAGETYEITIIFTDRGGAQISKDLQIIQGPDETGLYLQSTVDPDGGGSQTPANNTREYSEHINVLSQNRGGPTLAEDVTRRGNREADGVDNTDDQDTTNDATFDFTGGLADGGAWTEAGKQSGAVKSVAESLPAIIFASVADAAGNKSMIEVDVDARSITITLKEGETAADIKALLDAYFAVADASGADITGNTVAEINIVRGLLQQLFDMTTAITFTVNDGGTAGIANDDENGVTITLGSTNAPAPADAAALKTAIEGARLTGFGVRTKEGKAHETLTIEAGSITPPGSETAFTFAETVLTLFTDTDGNGTIDAGERADMTIYLTQEGTRDDGAGNQVPNWVVKAVRTADIGNAHDHATAPGLAAGGDGSPAIVHYIIGTFTAADGAYTPNIVTPEQWTIHHGEREDLNTTDSDHTAGERRCGRMVTMDLASDEEIGKQHHRSDEPQPGFPCRRPRGCDPGCRQGRAGPADADPSWRHRRL